MWGFAAGLPETVGRTRVDDMGAAVEDEACAPQETKEERGTANR